MIKKTFAAIMFCSLLSIYTIGFADSFSPNAYYEICFTPGENCAKKITDKIDQAKKEILLQAYNFTDISIANSLALAKTRGVDIRVILDKSQLKAKNSLLLYFISNNVKLFIDNKPAVAHNKLIIIDRHIVVGGSYNFTYAAKNKNAENIVIIDDHKFAEKYINYWNVRKNKSKEIKDLRDIMLVRKQLKVKRHVKNN